MHVLDMQLVLSLESLDVRARRKVFAVERRIRHITRDVQGRFAATGVIDTYKLEERAALRWMLWKLGVVIADKANPTWTEEHKLPSDEDLAVARRIAAETPVDARDEPALVDRIVRELGRVRRLARLPSPVKEAAE